MSAYLVLLYQDEQARQAMTDAQRAEVMEQHNEFHARHGANVTSGAALQYAATARKIAVGDGTMAVTDGPFVETKEALGGFYVIEADDLDAAIKIAADVPAQHGGVEVRPVMVFN